MSRIIRAITEITRCDTQYRTEALAPTGLKACLTADLTEAEKEIAERILDRLKDKGHSPECPFLMRLLCQPGKSQCPYA